MAIFRENAVFAALYSQTDLLQPHLALTSTPPKLCHQLSELVPLFAVLPRGSKYTNRKCPPPSAKYPKIHSASAQMDGNGLSSKLVDS